MFLSVGVNVIDDKDLDSQSTRQEVYDQCHYGLNLMDFEGINSESFRIYVWTDSNHKFYRRGS